MTYTIKFKNAAIAYAGNAAAAAVENAKGCFTAHPTAAGAGVVEVPTSKANTSSKCDASAVEAAAAAAEAGAVQDTDKNTLGQQSLPEVALKEPKQDKNGAGAAAENAVEDSKVNNEADAVGATGQRESYEGQKNLEEVVISREPTPEQFVDEAITSLGEGTESHLGHKQGAGESDNVVQQGGNGADAVAENAVRATDQDTSEQQESSKGQEPLAGSEPTSEQVGDGADAVVGASAVVGADAVGANEKSQVSSWWDYITSPFSSCCGNSANSQGGSDEIVVPDNGKSPNNNNLHNVTGTPAMERSNSVQSN